MIKKKYDEMNSRIGVFEALIVMTAALIYIGGVFAFHHITGSGYHLVDDHEFTAWVYLLKIRHIPLKQLITEYLSGNLSAGRWRPLYLIMRGLFIEILGTNIEAYYIWAIIKTAILFALIYYMLRLMGGKVIPSLLGTLISLTGYQSAAWWKLGTHEIVTAIWFVAGMIFMLIHLREARKRYAILSVISFFIMCLYKETFIVLIPFVILYAIYTDIRAGRADESVVILAEAWKDTIKSARARFLFYVILAVIMLGNIIIILTCTGNDYVDSEGFNISPLIESFGTDLKWFVRFGLLLAVILISHDVEVCKIWMEAVLLAAFLLPQFVLFSSFGITERYIIPSSIGFVIFFCLLAPIHMSIGRRRQLVYWSFTVILLLVHIRAMHIEATYFTYRGESVSEMLELVDERADESRLAGKEAPNILSCLYYEGSYLIYTHELLNDCDTVFQLMPNYPDWNWDMAPVFYDHYIGFRTAQPQIDRTSLNDIDIIVAYNQDDRHWSYDLLELNEFDLSDFEMTRCGTIDVYCRK